MSGKTERRRLAGSEINISPSRCRVAITVRIDEELLEKMKEYRIWPSSICRAAIRREVRKRAELEHRRRKSLDADLPMGYRSE